MNLALKEYADRHAGAPGAIYVGDLTQLAGPAVLEEYVSEFGYDLGDDEGNVPLSALEQHTWIYESDYYRTLLSKARLTSPTELATSGENITIQHTCAGRTLRWCKHLIAYFVPNVLERTDGQVKIEVTSFAELGLDGPDIPYHLADGTLSMAEALAEYVGTYAPVFEIQTLWGLWPDSRTHFEVATKLAPIENKSLREALGAQILMHNWLSGRSQFIFTNRRLDSKRDFRELKTRSHSEHLTNWIYGIGAEGQFVAFREVYIALEREVLDAAMTDAYSGILGRWYEVTDFMYGPLHGFGSSINVISDEVWNSIPEDLQHILIEEGAKHELEGLRLAAIQNYAGLQRNIDTGVEFVEFNPEFRILSYEGALEGVIPYWLGRYNYPENDDGTVDAFNEIVGPHIGLQIEPDGSIVKVPITEGPHAGKTMEQVLSE